MYFSAQLDINAPLKALPQTVAGLTTALLLVSCNPSPSETEIRIKPLVAETSTPSEESLQSLDLTTSMLVKQLLEEYVDQIDDDLVELQNKLVALHRQFEQLIATPDDSSLQLARDSWLTAHNSYEQSNLHRYFTSFVSTENQSEQLFRLTQQMDHWPILAGYIDSVSGYESGGIVHDVNVELSSDSLREQHGLFDITEATLGFHVIEFLLWGEPDSPSAKRGAEDFKPVTQLDDIQKESGMSLEQVGNNRRRELLLLTSKILLEDFESSLLIWDEAKARFMGSLEDRNSATLLNILLASATAMLTEELLVRSLYPMLNGDFEIAFQSPFSQTSENAVAAQLQSIESMLLETPTAEGVTVDKVLVSLSPVFEEFFYQNLDANKACLILLYSSLGQTRSATTASDAEFEVVECINLLTNLIDQLEQIKLTLPPFNRPV